MMQDMKMQARGKSLKDLVGAMEEDDAKSIPSLTIKISAGAEGIEVEKVGGEGEVEGAEEAETPGAKPGEEMDDAASEDMGASMPDGEGDDSGRSAFEMLIEKKKKEKEGRGGY